MIDEYTRKCLALEVGRRFTSDQLIELLGRLIAIHGVPQFLRSDNGPEFIARRVRDFLEKIDIGTSYIEPGSPWQNGYVESFNSRLRDECLACEEFSRVHEAQAAIGHWRQIYNHLRPHSSLDGLTPHDFSTRCTASASLPALQQYSVVLTQPELSEPCINILQASPMATGI